MRWSTPRAHLQLLSHPAPVAAAEDGSGDVPPEKKAPEADGDETSVAA